MPLQFDVTQYVSLIEAFERTGQAMFPEEWCGLEREAAPEGGMAQAAGERKRLQRKLSGIDECLATLHARFTADLPDEELQALQNEFHPVQEVRKQVDQALKALPIVQRHQLEDEARYTRRCAVEDALMGAFATKDLLLLRAPSEIVDWNGWTREKGFVVDFRLGVVRAPAMRSACRRAPGFVDKYSFESWLSAHYASPNAGLSPEGEFRRWFGEQVRQNPESPHPKAEFERIAKNGYGLPQMTFKRIWQNSAPAAWKKRGRRKKTVMREGRFSSTKEASRLASELYMI